jgi:FkbH-like protein
VRQNIDLQAQLGSTADRDAFLQQLDAEISFQFSTDSEDQRAFELVNKTNQFNINGVRCTLAEWRAKLSEPGAFLLTCSYADKFGSLGEIGVVQGTIEDSSVWVRWWVMSCRAFSRRIEFATLRELMEHFDVEEVELDYRPTDRNAPVRELLNALGIAVGSTVSIERLHFERACPKLFFKTPTQMRPSREALNDG